MPQACGRCSRLPQLAKTFLLCLFATAVASASHPPTTPFDELRFLIGRWRGEGTWPDVGHYRDEFTFAAILQDKFITCSYRMVADDQKVVWSDFWILGIDPVTKRLMTRNFALDGTLAWSSQAVRRNEQRDRWVFLGHTVGSADYSVYRFTMMKRDADHFSTKTEIPKGGRYVTLSANDYSRVTVSGTPQLR